MAAKVISFINMKGGVGKTTLCIGIGEFIAHYRNKKVLFIDLDPQFNLTQTMMNEYNLEEAYLNDYNENERTVKKIFENKNKVYDAPQCPTRKDIVVDLDDNISIVPGTINLILEDNRVAYGERKVSSFIDKNNLKSEFDFIFIDCPPTISLYTDAALYSSDNYIVPNKIDRYSILGIKLLDQAIENLKYNNEQLKLQPLGIIYTSLDSGVLTDKTVQLMNKFESSEIVEKYGIFTGRTRYVRDLQVGHQGNISSKYINSKEDISIISDEFLRRINDACKDE